MADQRKESFLPNGTAAALLMAVNSGWAAASDDQRRESLNEAERYLDERYHFVE